jgi:DNA repair protein RecO (recombination protein O)
MSVGEADRILTVFTKHYGKIRAMAKGVRKITSRRGGNVELFNRVTLFLSRGRNFDLLSEAQVLDSYKVWRKDLKKVGVAYYFCELVDRLTPEAQENQAVFELLKDYLGRLNKESLSELARGFEERLLEELGFGVPEALKKRPGSLKGYIESIIEKEIRSPKILRELS